MTTQGGVVTWRVVDDWWRFKGVVGSGGGHGTAAGSVDSHGTL